METVLTKDHILLTNMHYRRVSENFTCKELGGRSYSMIKSILRNDLQLKLTRAQEKHSVAGLIVKLVAEGLLLTVLDNGSTYLDHYTLSVAGIQRMNWLRRQQGYSAFDWAAVADCVESIDIIDCSDDDSDGSGGTGDEEQPETKGETKDGGNKPKPEVRRSERIGKQSDKAKRPLPSPTYAARKLSSPAESGIASKTEEPKTPTILPRNVYVHINDVLEDGKKPILIYMPTVDGLTTRFKTTAARVKCPAYAYQYAYNTPRTVHDIVDDVCHMLPLVDSRYMLVCGEGYGALVATKVAIHIQALNAKTTLLLLNGGIQKTSRTVGSMAINRDTHLLAEFMAFVCPESAPAELAKRLKKLDLNKSTIPDAFQLAQLSCKHDMDHVVAAWNGFSKRICDGIQHEIKDRYDGDIHFLRSELAEGEFMLNVDRLQEIATGKIITVLLESPPDQLADDPDVAEHINFVIASLDIELESEQHK